jgi:hypothetical protein
MNFCNSDAFGCNHIKKDNHFNQSIGSICTFQCTHTSGKPPPSPTRPRPQILWLFKTAGRAMWKIWWLGGIPFFSTAWSWCGYLSICCHFPLSYKLWGGDGIRREITQGPTRNRHFYEHGDLLACQVGHIFSYIFSSGHSRASLYWIQCQQQHEACVIYLFLTLRCASDN